MTIKRSFVLIFLTVFVLAGISCRSNKTKKSELNTDNKIQTQGGDRVNSTVNRPNPNNNKYQNRTSAPRNATHNIPKVLPPGSSTTYSRVSNVRGKYLALTFDDGPHPSNTRRLLDILAKRNVKATFYVVGKNVNRYPSLIRRMVREGHEIGNHTWNHPNLNKQSRSKVQEELARTGKAIHRVSGIRPRTMRPPYGAFRQELRNWTRNQFGYPTILWSVDPKDWKDRNASTVTRRLVSGAKPGAILLAHDIHKSTIDAMPSTLDQLLRKGYQFVTVTQLIQLGKGAVSRPIVHQRPPASLTRQPVVNGGSSGLPPAIGAQSAPGSRIMRPVKSDPRLINWTR